MTNGVLQRWMVLVSITALVLATVPALAAPSTTPTPPTQAMHLGLEASPQDAMRFAATQQGLMLEPTEAPPSPSFTDAMLRLYTVADLSTNATVQEDTAEFADSLDPRLRAELTPLIDTLAQAVVLRNQAFHQEDLVSIAPMAEAAIALLDTAQDQAQTLEALPADAWPSSVTPDPTHGLIAIGTTGNDTYEYDEIRWFQIDPAGDDHYHNNPGGAVMGATFSFIVLVPIALTLDLSGDDTYQRDSPYVQGSGHRAVGVLVDEAGNDTYQAGREVQGSGGNGVGVLWDKAGNDSYTSTDNDGQGFAAVGIGLLQDEGGNDSYWASDYSMGMGSTLGVGMLRDLGGDDVYDGDSSGVMGYALERGRGYFYDYGFGNDSYVFHGNDFASNNDSWNRTTVGVIGAGYGYGWDGGEPSRGESVNGITGGEDLGYGSCLARCGFSDAVYPPDP